jgi:hypothetical protein
MRFAKGFAPSQAKRRGINGTCAWVSKKHLQLYLREFEYRHNLRKQPSLIFELLLQAFPKYRLSDHRLQELIEAPPVI